MTIHNVDLSKHYETLVGELVQSGRYKDADDVVREGLRLVEQREREDSTRLALLRRRLDAAEADVVAGAVVTYRPGLLDEIDAEERAAWCDPSE